jgi:glycosyltransferase involved in cell wall biosynthesis
MFGTPPKAMRCGAFKVTEALAMAKPVITGRTPAMEEFLTEKENVLFCKMGDSQDLADKILELKNDPLLRKKIAAGGYNTYLEKLTPKVLGANLLNIINNINL